MDFIKRCHQILSATKDKKKQEKLLRDECERSSAFLSAMIEWCLGAGMRQIIYRYRSGERVAAARSTGKPAISSSAVSRRIAREVKTLMDSYTIGDKSLGDCCRVELLQSAMEKEADGRGKLANAAFERAIAARLKDEKQTVRKAVSEDELQLLKKASGHGSRGTHGGFARRNARDTPDDRIGGVA